MPRLKKLLNRAYKNLETRQHELLYLFMEITRRCNLNCLHCGSDCKSGGKEPELSKDSWIKIVDYMADHFKPELTFVITGGEPLLYDGLSDIGRHIHNRGRRWGIVTNGMALTSDKLHSLMSAGISSITLSLDGLEASHNTLRNHPQAFNRILSALEIVGKSDIAFRDAVTCVNPMNIDELDKVADILLDKGISSWRLFRIFPSGRAKGNKKLLLSFEDSHRMLNWIVDNRKHYKQKGLNLSFSCEGYLPLDLDLKVRDTPFFCRAGINIASILSNGNITGCSNNDPHFYEGNILKDNFQSLWENAFQKFRNHSWSQVGVCAHCDEFKDCQGSSIHLWHNPADGIEFCYLKNKT